MRPIDADKIHYCNYDLDNYHSFRAVTDDEIDEMPTLTYEDLAPQWISVKDRLPEKSGDYLVTTYNGSRTCLPYSSKNRAFNSFDGNTDHGLDIQCTHWMPLPEPPKE